MILRHPFFRTPLGRAIELGGAAALIAKGATVIRDWEPGPGTVATGAGHEPPRCAGTDRASPDVTKS